MRLPDSSAEPEQIPLPIGETAHAPVDARVDPCRESAQKLSTGRHPRDLAQLIAAAAAVTLAVLIAVRGGVNPVESSIFRELDQLPQWSRPVWYALASFGTAPAVVAAAGLALYLKRIRLGSELAVAGGAAWILSRVADWTLDNRAVPAALLTDPSVRTPGAAGFPIVSGHVAVAAALAGVASPYLPRFARNTSWAGVVLVGVADVYLGRQLPVGTVAGGFLGWALAAVVHVLWGAPGRRTSEAAVMRALTLAGLQPVDVLTVKRRPLGPVEFDVRTASGDRLRTEVIRRLRRRGGPGHKLRRFLASLEVEDEPRLSTPHHEAEHEALLTLLAERAGVRTPPVVLARAMEHGPAFVVRRNVSGRRLSELTGDEIDDTLLDEVWHQVATLGKARIAHHDLRTSKLLIDHAGRPWILDFTFAKAGASVERICQDAAQAMISLAGKVGPERAVTSALRVLPQESAEGALPHLQSIAVPRRFRKQLGADPRILPELRDTLAERIGCPVPAYRLPIRPTTLVSLAVCGAAVYLLLPQLSSLRQVLDAFGHANYWWLATAGLLGLVAIPVSALTLLGASKQRLPFWRTVAVQLAAAFTGRTTPGGIGFYGINLIYLERLGIRRAQAIGVVLLNRAATMLVSAVGFSLGVVALGASPTLGRVKVPSGWPVLVGVSATLVLAGVALGSPVGRRRIVRPSLEVGRELWDTVRHPARAVELFGATAGFMLLSALGLVVTTAAFHVHFSVVTVLAVYVAGATIAQLAPTPGSLGAVETTLVALMTAVGIASTSAVAAVLTMRLLTFWLPVLPGIAMFRYLQHRKIV